VGCHTIKWTVTDAGGNTAECVQSVHINSNLVIDYRGDACVFTAGPNVAKASVLLKANLAPPASAEPWPTLPDENLTVQFTAKDQSGKEQGTLTVPVDANGNAQGVMSLPAVTAPGTTATTYDIVIKLFYDGATCEVDIIPGGAQAIVTLGSANRRMVGGGWVANAYSDNGKATFGFEAAPYAKSKALAQGNTVFMLHGVTLNNARWNIKVKDASWSSSVLAFYQSVGGTLVDSARLTCNGVAQQIDPRTGASTGYGGCTIVVDVFDGDLYTKATRKDMYSITVYDNKNKILWFSVPSKVPLGGGGPGGGNITVFSK
jgi:hypothetical protein